MAPLEKKRRTTWLYLLPAILVLGWAAFYAVAFVQIYSHEHVYKLASKWIYENIEPGSIILGGDWDDTLPVHLPGYNPRQYKFGGNEWVLRLYERDSKQKLKELTTKVAQGDYIIFPTQRHVGSILRVPQEYPYTDAFLRLLFAEKLGYRLLKTVKVKPYFGSFTFDDDLADESFSVYDHPKVTIFKNVNRFTAQTLEEVIVGAKAHMPLPTNAEIMQRDSGELEDLRPHGMPALAQMLVWLLALEGIALLFFPILAYCLPSMPDKGYALAKTCSVLVIGLITWLVCFLGGAPFTAITIDAILVVVGIASILIVNKFWGSWGALLRSIKGHIFTTELIFIGGFALLLLCRAFKPEIFWGEKPMDFTFLNYFVRLETLPPHDPWAAGNLMHYYYFGTFLFALLHKITGVVTGVGYNLAIATIAGLLLVTAYGVVLLITRRRVWACIGAIMVVLFSNFDLLILTFINRKEINFDLFWASSRTLQSPGINEYPLWSLLFADLHAHLIALPITILVIGLGFALLAEKSTPFDTGAMLRRVLLGGCWGSLFITNSWDFITYGFFAGLSFLCLFGVLWTGTAGRVVIRFAKTILFFIRDAVIVLTSAFIVILPFLLVSAGSLELSYNWVGQNEFNNLFQVLRHFGHWILLLVPALLVVFGMDLLFVFREKSVLKLSALFMAAVLATFPILLGIVSTISGTLKVPWAILLFAALILFGGFVLLFGKKERYSAANTPVNLQMIGILLVLGAFMLTFAELVFLKDRMNTLFKFYNAIWILWGLAAAGLMPFIWNFLWLEKVSIHRRVFVIELLAVFVLCLASSVINVSVMTTFQRIPGPRPTLDGTRYLYNKDGDEAKLYEWINTNINGTPVMLEAQKQSYADYTRVAMNTGLPTVLGWDHHVYQRGTTRKDIRQRQLDIKRIYSSPEPHVIFGLLSKYNVSLIVVGNLEYRTYGRLGLEKFEHFPEIFSLLFQSGKVKLYGVKGSTVFSDVNES
ncbi:DUF2298 domain-containing protein [Oligoflexia bacterium]|nr:DUF2298 domain-containing protein [Oligoflexia bacterium]